jgi:hypothetical protein
MDGISLYSTVTMAYTKYGNGLAKGGILIWEFSSRLRAPKRLGWAGVLEANDLSEFFGIALTE